MRIASYISHPVLSNLNPAGSAQGIRTTRNNGQNSQVDTLIAENNKRLDGVLRHRNPSPEVRAKVEELRKQFNERMTQVAQGTSDRGRIMNVYRDARSQLSDAMTGIFGGPRAG
ncbi:MAG: hypothetical protein AABZ53_17020 [Planctomycetota bacterium]